MKTKIVTLIFTLCILIQSCVDSYKSLPIGDCLYILRDCTDSLEVYNEITVKDILFRLQINSDKSASAIIRLVPITNFRFEKHYTVSISQMANTFLGNDVHRRNDIDSFKSQLSKHWQFIQQMPKGADGSAIFETIIAQLDELTNCQQEIKKQLIVLSDLLELMPWFNAYKSNQLETFVKNPAAFAKMMAIHCPNKNSFKGIEVYLIHRPKQVIEDDQFYKLSFLLKGYLENLGARVLISANLY